MEKFYVLESGAYIKKEGAVLAVFRGRQKIGEIPLRGLKQLVLVGRSSFSGAVLDVLIRERIETVLLTPEGRFRARLVVDEHAHVERRRAQYLVLSDPEASLNVARKIVSAKLRDMAHFLMRKSEGGKEELLRESAIQIRALARLAEETPSLETLRGLEGHGSSVYFSVFSRLIGNKSFFFEERSRRPPRDPVNAMLSFVYTLLTGEVLTAVQSVGLDPYLGALHAVEYGRPSLACDLVEEWRTFMGERFVLRLINLGMVKPEDFVFRTSVAADGVDEEDLRKNRPVEMKPAMLRAFLQAYEKWMQTRLRCPLTGQKRNFRGLIHDQSRRFARFLLGEDDEYRPFPWWEVA
ncbi:CRISPR-associated endonuclease Cas1 [Thermodesulforhabdus norvegica]|uniref:CRISPR-associated endonuclease Cas1 n=1 Tax=Thermodesulforhabdus norvegica TaxID=39841 RepID=A0A1I4TB21_9BACT|nr:CRISPR-associated endonuclease Cas1 [Thermodesulforhabdus norvegica]SFM73855.1 CRISPR-associated protein, Cas1 family [Thermodesulforhabdus norvegica]